LLGRNNFLTSLSKAIIPLVLLVFTSNLFAINLEVNITGVNKELKQLINNELTLYSAISEPKLTKRRIHNLYDLSIPEIATVLESSGYYNSNIKRKITSTTDEHWIITFNIDCGPQVRINKIVFKASGPGKDNPNLNKAFDADLEHIKSGQVFTHDKYEDTKTSLLQALNQYGYLKAHIIVASVNLNRDLNLADIFLELETGIRFKFGEVDFDCNHFKDDLLRRYIPFKANEDYTLAKIQEFHKNLESSEFFKKIRIDTMPDFLNDIVNIHVRLETKPLSRYYGNIGYGTTSGARIGLGWNRTLESQPGHKIGANTKLSAMKKSANLSYAIPGKQAANDHYIFSINVLEEKIEERYSLKSEASFTKEIKRKNIELNYSVDYFGEKFRLTKNAKKNLKKFLLPGFRIIWFHENNFKINFFIRLAHKGLASDGSLAFIDLNTKKIFTINDDNKFIIRTELGTVVSKDFAQLPPSLRFFAGGDYSVRGFKYKSIGPSEPQLIPTPAVDPNAPAPLTPAEPKYKNVVVGGKHLFIMNFEYERRIYKDLGAAIFFDMGNAFNCINAKSKLAMGAGIGARYKTPIGSIRIDFAKPLYMGDKKKIMIHLSFGADF
jgi:translocation and assembly module TamA